MPAELAEKLSDHPGDDVTDSDEREAIKSIINDFLLCGKCYPPRGGRQVIDAATVLRESADEEEINAMLAALMWGHEERLDYWRGYAQRLVEESAGRVLRDQFPALIERRIEEMDDAG